MARKRKKDTKTPEAESLQGELLSSVDPGRGSRPEPSADVEDGVGSARAGSAEDGVASGPVAPSGRVGERWAKAVGRRAPSRRSIGRVPTSGGSPGVTSPGGALDAATGAMRGVAEAARDHAATVRSSREPLARAKELVRQGRIQEAIELYLGILTVNASNVKAHNNLGVLLDGLKRWEAALEHLEAAERLAPDNVEVLTNYASTLTSLARYEEAEDVLRRAQKLDADNLQVRVAIAILYFRRGLYSQAEAELRWVCARARDIGLAFYYRGEALNRLGRFDESKQALDRAAELLPNDPRPFYTLGHLYDRKHLPEEASRMYRRARRLQRS